MSKIKSLRKVIDFQDYLDKQLQNSQMRKYYEKYGKQLEIAYQILKLRKQKRISQAELAKKLGTTQSNVARMETGQQNFTIETLQKITKVFNCGLKIEFVI